jgi:hypothetical protein
MQYSRIIASGLVASIGAVSSAVAQSEGSMAVEVRPSVGVWLPTGEQRNDFSASTSFGLQGAVEFSSRVHGVISGSWTRSSSKFASFSNKSAHIWQFDAGAEYTLVHRLTGDWRFRPFVGAGAGVRTYDYPAAGVGSKGCAAGYGALGTEFQRREVAIRLESRDYLSCFDSPITGVRRTRNDAVLSFGIAYHMF